MPPLLNPVLARCRTLRRLRLEDCPDLEEDGVELLTALPALELLDLRGSYRVTRPFVAGLRERMPGCEIVK